MNIIDTKSDLGFKKVFGEKPHLLMSLLNNLLPLSEPIVSIQYLTPEIIPDQKDGKNSIVDVRCTDNGGRHFIVEMQVGRQSGYTKRVLTNATKIYSRQLTKEAHFNMAQPVYSLNILDHRYKLNDQHWYHHYLFTSKSDYNDIWEDLQIILIELPKWRKMNKFDLNNPQDRWLMYFTEPNAFDRLSETERSRYDEIYEAMETLEVQNFTPEQILGYELYIDNIRQYVTTMTVERQEGKQEGLEVSLEIIDALKRNEESPEEIAQRLHVSLDMVLRLKRSL